MSCCLTIYYYKRRNSNINTSYRWCREDWKIPVLSSLFIGCIQMIRQCSRCLHVTIAIFRCFRVLVVCTFRHITIEEPAVYSSSKTLSLFQTFQFSRRYHWLHLYVTFFFFWMNHALTISCSSHLIHLPRSRTCLPPSLSSPRAHLHVVGMLRFMFLI